MSRGRKVSCCELSYSREKINNKKAKRKQLQTGFSCVRLFNKSKVLCAHLPKSGPDLWTKNKIYPDIWRTK